MMHEFTPCLEQKSVKALCRYINSSSHIQIVKITEIHDRYFERTVFPGQQLLFEAPPEAHLEIFTGEIMQAIITDRIPCYSLKVQQENVMAFLPEEAVKFNHNTVSTQPCKISLKEDVLL